MNAEPTVEAMQPGSVRPEDIRWKRWTRRVLLLVFCIGIFLTVMLVWLHNQITDTDRYVRTVSPLASDVAIQDAIVTSITDGFSARLDVASTRDILSDRNRNLAAPLTAAMTDYVERIAREVVTSDQFEQLWVDLNTAVHPAVSALLTGSGTENVSTANGKVTVDLAPVVDAVSAKLQEHGVDLFSRASNSRVSASIVIVDSPDLANAQDIVRYLDSLVIVIPIVTLLALIGYFILSVDRRSAFIWSGLGLAAAMAILLWTLSAGRWQYLSRFASNADSATATAYFDVIGHYLRLAARLLALFGLLVAGVAVVTRPGGLISRAFAALGRLLSRDEQVTGGQLAGSDRSWIEQHRGALIGLLLAVFCIAVVTPNQLPQSLGRTAMLALILGLIALWLLPRFIKPDQLALAPAGAGTTVTVSVPTNLPAPPPIIDPLSSSTSMAERGPAPAPVADTEPLAETAPQLSPQDLAVLQRLASALRDIAGTSVPRPN